MQIRRPLPVDSGRFRPIPAIFYHLWKKNFVEIILRFIKINFKFHFHRFIDAFQVGQAQTRVEYIGSDLNQLH